MTRTDADLVDAMVDKHWIPAEQDMESVAFVNALYEVLALQRAEVHAQYLRVAEELEELGLRRAVNAHTSGRIDAARRIRQVAQ